MKTVILYNNVEKNILDTSVVIDPDKIRRELIKRNLTQIEVSEAMGYGRNSLASAINAGVFPGHLVKNLDRLYNIKLADYEMRREEPKAPEQTQEAPAITDKALYETMKNAVLDAMNEALARNMPNLRGMVLAAIRGAQQ